MIEMKKQDDEEYWAWKSHCVKLFFETAHSLFPSSFKHDVFSNGELFSSLMRDTPHGNDCVQYIVKNGGTRFKEYRLTAAVPISSAAKADAAIDSFIDTFNKRARCSRKDILLP